MADIFISYARADRDKIEKLAAALEAEGYSVWWDRHIEGGAEFSKDIESAIKDARAVIVAWSAASIESHWVRDEAVYARDHEKMIPIQLDETEPPMGFRQVQAIDFTKPTDNAHAALKRSVALRLGEQQTDDAVSASASPSPSTPSATTAKPDGLNLRDPKIIGGGLALLALVLVATVMMRGGEKAPPDDVASNIPGVAERVAVPAPPVVATASSDNNVVAVLPFANRSANEDDAFFADGMHDDLLTKLSKISALQVISRTSVMRFRDTEQPIPEIANMLGAAVVMEGAVQRAGNRVRINVQLIDGKTDQHLWAEIYDRELTTENIFDIQEEITRAIAGALEAVLSGDDEAALKDRPTENVAAYNSYLRAIAVAPQVYTITQSQIDRSINALDDAIALDPNFAAAYARKGYSQLMAYWLLRGGDQWRDAALKSLTRAQTIAPNEIETLLTRGYYLYWGTLDYNAADQVFDQILARAPNHAEASAAKAFTQRRRGNYEKALEGLLRVKEIDPLDVSNFLEISDTAGRLGQWEIAQAALDRALALAPRHPGVATYRYFLARRMGDAARAWREINRPVDGADHRLFQWRLEVAILTRSRQNIEAALTTWPVALRTPENLPESYEIAKAEALYEMGERDEAMEVLIGAKATIDARDVSYPGGWGANTLIHPVALPGLMGDLQTVVRLAGEFEARPIKDSHGDTSVYFSLAIAFARAGDPERAIGYLERIVEIQEASRFIEFTIIPAFDTLHDHPRWAAMKARYDEWAAENEVGE